jgi:hypothetical protein
MFKARIMMVKLVMNPDCSASHGVGDAFGYLVINVNRIREYPKAITK